MQIKTEKKIKRFLSNLPDGQIKKLFNGVEVSPFPILLTIEYEKRFGKKNKKLQTPLRKKLRGEHLRQRKLLREFKTDLKKLEQLTISTSGIDKLSKDSIEEIQLKRSKCMQRIQKTTKELEKTSRSILLRENELANMRNDI